MATMAHSPTAQLHPGAVVAPQPVPMTAKAEIAGDRKEAKNAAKSPAA